MAPRRRLITVLALVLAAFLGLALAVRILVPKERLIQVLAQRVETATGWRLAARDAAIGLLPPSVRVSDLVLSGNPAYDDSSEIRIPSVQIHTRLAPLLRGRLQFTGATIEKPSITLSVLPAAERRQGGTAAPSPGAKGPTPLAISLDRLEVTDAKIAYRDTTGFEVVLRGLALSLSLDPNAGFSEIKIPGDFAAADVAVAMPLYPRPGEPRPDSLPIFRVGGFRAAGTYQCVLHPREGTLDIERSEVRVNDLVGNVTGRVTNLSKIPNVEIAVAASDASIADLLSLLPETILARKQELEAAGRATIDARFSGPTYPPGSMRAEGSVDLAESRVAYKGIPGSIEGLAGRIRFTQERIDIDSLVARSAGEPFRLAGSVLLTPPTKVDLDIAGTIPLDVIGRWPAISSVENLGGSVRIRARATGALGPPQALRIDGALDLKNVSAKPRGWTTPVEGVSGRVTLAGNDAKIEGVQGRMGASDFRVDGTVSALFSKTPTARLTVASHRLDLDALAQSAGAPGAAGQPAGAAVVAAPLALPELPPIRANVTVRADSLVAQKIPLRDARGEIELADRVLHAVLTAGEVSVPSAPLSAARLDLTIKNRRLDGSVTAGKVQVGGFPVSDVAARISVLPDGVLDITGGRAKAFSGSVAGNVRIALAGQEPRYTFDLQASDLEMNDFLSHLTPAKNAIFGRLKLNGKFNGAGLTAREAMAKLTAEGDMLATDGRFATNASLTSMANALGLPELADIRFRTLRSAFQIAGGRIGTEDLRLDSPDAKWAASGSIGFDGTLDYRLEVLLSKPLADRAIKKYGDMARYLVNEKGELPVNLIVTGKVTAPSVNVDFSKAMSRAAGGAMRDAARRAAGDAARSMGIPESAAVSPKEAPTESSVVKGLLDRIIGGRKPEPAPKETTAAPKAGTDTTKRDTTPRDTTKADTTPADTSKSPNKE